MGSLLILFCSWFDLKFLPFVACLLSSCSSFSLLVMTVVLARRTRAVSARFYGVLDLEFAISDSVLFQPESRRTRVKSWRHSRNICRRGVKIPFVAGLWEKKHQNWDWTSCMRHPTRYLLLVGVCTQDSHLLSHFFLVFFLPNEISSWKEIGTEKTLVSAADGLITKPEVRGDFDKMAIDCITEEWRDFPWKSVVVFESKSQSSAKKMSKMWLS